MTKIITLITTAVLFIVVAIFSGLFSASGSVTAFPADLSPSNIDTLNQAAEALSHIQYGFEPLLTDDRAEVVILNEVAYLGGNLQPEEPNGWANMDCFTFAYAARDQLLQQPGIADVQLGLMKLPVTRGDVFGLTNHVAAKVEFEDGTQTTVDLTPLTAGIVTSHELEFPDVDIDTQFQIWRRQIPLERAQPMLVTQHRGRDYYLLASVVVLANEYQLMLRGYEYTPATATEPLAFEAGGDVGITFKRDGYEQLQARIIADGPRAFNENHHLLTWQGDDDPRLRQVLEGHLYILWHMATKLVHSAPAQAATQSPNGGQLGVFTAGPGETTRIRMTAVPGSTPEENPVMVLKIVLIDAATGEPVRGTISFDGEILARDVAAVTVSLPGQVPEYKELRVEAEGYWPRSQDARWTLNHSRVMDMPLQMRRR